MKSTAVIKAPRRVAKLHGRSGRASTTRTLFERLKAFDGKADDLPADLALQHDHYLYGVAKRPTR